MEAIPKVCRTASTLYELMAYYKTLNLDGKPESERGLANWSHSLRKAVGNWYLEKSPIDVAMQVGTPSSLLNTSYCLYKLLAISCISAIQGPSVTVEIWVP